MPNIMLLVGAEEERKAAEEEYEEKHEEKRKAIEEQTSDKGFLARIQHAWNAFIAQVKQAWHAMTKPIKKFFITKGFNTIWPKITKLFSDLFESDEDKKVVGQVAKVVGTCAVGELNKDQPTVSGFLYCAADGTAPIVFSSLMGNKKKSDPKREGIKIKSNEKKSFFPTIF